MPHLFRCAALCTLAGIGTMSAACSDNVAPDEFTRLGPLATLEMGLEGENPQITQVDSNTWQVRVVTWGACPFIRSIAEVVYRERMAQIYPYEVRRPCGERPLRFGTHESIQVSFPGDGEWTILVMGASGVESSDTVLVAR